MAQGVGPAMDGWGGGDVLGRKKERSGTVITSAVGNFFDFLVCTTHESRGRDAVIFFTEKKLLLGQGGYRFLPLWLAFGFWLFGSKSSCQKPNQTEPKSLEEIF
jgi:hypothetical protein